MFRGSAQPLVIRFQIAGVIARTEFLRAEGIPAIRVVAVVRLEEQEDRRLRELILLLLQGPQCLDPLLLELFRRERRLEQRFGEQAKSFSKSRWRNFPCRPNEFATRVAGEVRPMFSTASEISRAERCDVPFTSIPAVRPATPPFSFGSPRTPRETPPAPPPPGRRVLPDDHADPVPEDLLDHGPLRFGLRRGAVASLYASRTIVGPPPREDPPCPPEGRPRQGQVPGSEVLLRDA